MKAALLRFDRTLARDPAIDAWFAVRPGKLGASALHWFGIMRDCGDEVRELLHDKCPVSCFGDYPFASVNVFTAHINVSFFQGTSLPDPTALLVGTGRYMRHIKLRPGIPVDATAVEELIQAAYAHVKSCVEQG